MSVFIQTITVGVIVVLAAGYAAWLIYKRFGKRHRPFSDPSNPCDGCEGCSLKQEIREKSCPKGLFPSK